MPTGAELTLENTYPLEAATGLSLVYGGSSQVSLVFFSRSSHTQKKSLIEPFFLSRQISIIIVLVAAGYLAEELDPDEYDDKKQVTQPEVMVQSNICALADAKRKLTL